MLYERVSRQTDRISRNHFKNALLVERGELRNKGILNSPGKDNKR